MEIRKIFLIIVIMSALGACTSSKKSVYWVSGIKVNCSSGAGKGSCLRVYKGDDLANLKWQNFYAPIKDFTYKPGELQKIRVSETKKNEADVPQDASSIDYALVRVLETMPDKESMLNGTWVPQKINNHAIDRSAKLPNISFEAAELKVNGNDGCNDFRGSIRLLNQSELVFAPLMTTRKACMERNVSDEFMKALTHVAKYDFENDILFLKDKNDTNLGQFMRAVASNVDSQINDIWNVVRINRHPLNRMAKVPSIEINIKKMLLMGNDGCNNITGKIEVLTNSEIKFGPIATTQKACVNMQYSDEFNKALGAVNSYELDGLNLILKNEAGEEVLAFLKGD